jgi:hypothetical protein
MCDASPVGSESCAGVELSAEVVELASAADAAALSDGTGVMANRAGDRTPVLLRAARGTHAVAGRSDRAGRPI